jgi:hypothetical protein
MGTLTQGFEGIWHFMTASLLFPRVAIDLLLSRSEELSGTTEAELQESLGLELTE